MKSFHYRVVLAFIMAIGVISGVAGPLKETGLSVPAPRTMERRAILDGRPAPLGPDASRP